jgi:predicted lipid-binding transport protein (Tim44 family)
VLEAAARRAVAAWAEAVDGDDAALEEVATPEAVSELLYGSDESRKTRVVVRGPRVRQIRIVAVDVKREPATMTIEVELRGRRYVEDRDTAAVIGGSKEHAVAFTARWMLAATSEHSAPWRIVAPRASASSKPSLRRSGS